MADSTITPVEARKLWADALRSGKYKQRKGILRRGDCYCCLGVACEVYQEHVGDLAITEDAGGNTKFNSHSAFLPHKVGEWLDITSAGDYVSGECSLLNCNDTLNFTFAQIADEIETKPLLTYKDDEAYH